MDWASLIAWTLWALSVSIVLQRAIRNNLPLQTKQRDSKRGST